MSGDQIKPGYKRTEVGLIPEHWDAAQLGTLTTLMTNGFVGTIKNDYVDSEEGVLYIQGYNVEENGFNFRGIKRVSKEFHARNSKSCLRSGDLLTIQTGDIGVTTIVPPSLVGANCHALVISRFNLRICDPAFYCHYFNSKPGRIAFKEIETGSTMKHLNVGDMVKLFVPTPPLTEQRAIASALSDVDALLAKLDRLIAKKRDLKQATMQQLLTGQMRLPGFSGEWVVKRLGDVAKLYQPETISQAKFVGYGYPVFGANGVVGMYDKYNHKTSQITISCRGNCGTVNRTHGPAWITGNAMVVNLDDNKNLDKTFVYYKLAFADLTVLVTGSGIPQIVRGSMSAFEISFPADLEEQTAIATVISDIDTEISVLESRRDKTRELKQGMMQDLLTGRIRLL